MKAKLLLMLLCFVPGMIEAAGIDSHPNFSVSSSNSSPVSFPNYLSANFTWGQDAFFTPSASPDYPVSEIHISHTSPNENRKTPDNPSTELFFHADGRSVNRSLIIHNREIIPPDPSLLPETPALPTLPAPPPQEQELDAFAEPFLPLPVPETEAPETPVLITPAFAAPAPPTIPDKPILSRFLSKKSSADFAIDFPRFAPAPPASSDNVFLSGEVNNPSDSPSFPLINTLQRSASPMRGFRPGKTQLATTDTATHPLLPSGILGDKTSILGKNFRLMDRFAQLMPSSRSRFSEDVSAAENLRLDRLDFTSTPIGEWIIEDNYLFEDNSRYDDWRSLRLDIQALHSPMGNMSASASSLLEYLNSTASLTDTIFELYGPTPLLLREEFFGGGSYRFIGWDVFTLNGKKGTVISWIDAAPLDFPRFTVPEPAAWVMMLLGGVLLLALRRRKVKE